MDSAFVENIDYEDVNSLNSQLDTYPSHKKPLNTSQTKFSLFQKSATSTFPATNKNSMVKCYPHNQVWFGPKCNKARRKYHAAKYDYNQNKSPENKVRLNFASKDYKKTMNLYIKKEKENQSKRLRSLSEKNPKKYWKFLNTLKPKQKVIEHPSLDDFS